LAGTGFGVRGPHAVARLSALAASTNVVTLI
jgi:hypothetical protein